MALFCVIRWKKEEGRWKMEEGRWKREEGRWKREDGRGKMEEGRRKNVFESLTFSDFAYNNSRES